MLLFAIFPAVSKDAQGQGSMAVTIYWDNLLTLPVLDKTDNSW